MATAEWMGGMVMDKPWAARGLSVEDRIEVLFSPDMPPTVGFQFGRLASREEVAEAMHAVRRDALEEAAKLRLALVEAWKAMNYLGDILNGMDACTEEDEAATAAAFQAVREALGEAEAERIARELWAEAAEAKEG